MNVLAVVRWKMKTQTDNQTASATPDKVRTKAERKAERLSWAIWAAGVHSEENKRTIPAEKPTEVTAEGLREDRLITIAKGYKAHADKLAECVKDMRHDLDIFYSKYREPGNKYIVNLKAALAAYESEVR